MSRFSRINTIWRKELIDTLRDRRTLLAMVLVPMVLYPALMLGSLQALEVQTSQVLQEEFIVAVGDKQAARWLRTLIDSDPARLEHIQARTAEERIAQAATQPAPPEDARRKPTGGIATIRAGTQVPTFQVVVVDEPLRRLLDKQINVVVSLDGPPPPPDAEGSAKVTLHFDETDFRSRIAKDGLLGVFERESASRLNRRLARYHLTPEFVSPIELAEENVAGAEQMAGAALGQILPLILIIMTITGSIYPAIDLTAGERERGTLETLMVAPVPAVDLIAGKFVVVALVGLLSAVLNLLSVGGTVYLGGVGEILTQGRGFTLPLGALPIILLLLVPLAVMFSAILLAVCSFARSFKEAQNYVVPVMLAAMIPGVVGVLPGTRLEGPIVIMPVANIVVLARDLLTGPPNWPAIAVVVLSTSLYAGAAVAIAAKLFGQEAVLFADSGSVRTLFMRRFFEPRSTPTAAQALFIMTVAYTLNFYVQNALGRSSLAGGPGFLLGVALTLIAIYGLAPWLAARYTRVNPVTAFRLARPPTTAIVAAICFGCSTWILALCWIRIQEGFLPIAPDFARAMEEQFGWFNDLPVAVLVVFLALVPAIVEELFFRGYALSGLQRGVGSIAAVVIVAAAFGLSHFMAARFVQTAVLGALLGLLVVRSGSIYPAMIAHFMHNAISVLAGRADGLQPVLDSLGFPTAADAGVPAAWTAGALTLVGVGIALCFLPRRASAASASVAAEGRADLDAARWEMRTR